MTNQTNLSPLVAEVVRRRGVAESPLEAAAEEEERPAAAAAVERRLACRRHPACRHRLCECRETPTLPPKSQPVVGAALLVLSICAARPEGHRATGVTGGREVTGKQDQGSPGLVLG